MKKLVKNSEILPKHINKIISMCKGDKKPNIRKIGYLLDENREDSYCFIKELEEKQQKLNWSSKYDGGEE